MLHHQLVRERIVRALLVMWGWSGNFGNDVVEEAYTCNTYAMIVKSFYNQKSDRAA
jgi:hypothetical protein